jgi:phosphoglycolate phosphatase
MSEIKTLPTPSAVIWDMDGTLIDQTAAIIECYQEVILALGKPKPDPDRIRRSLGGPMADTMSLFIEVDEMEQASKNFRSLFPDIMFNGLIVLPGARRLIQYLEFRGIPQAILTNKHGPTARIVSKHCNFLKYIPTCIGNTDTQWHKPERELTEYVLETIDSTAENACLIGDSPTDVMTARNAELVCYGVSTGAHSVEELIEAGAAYASDSLENLLAAFKAG